MHARMDAATAFAPPHGLPHRAAWLAARSQPLRVGARSRACLHQAHAHRRAGTAHPPPRPCMRMHARMRLPSPPPLPASHPSTTDRSCQGSWGRTCSRPASASSARCASPTCRRRCAHPPAPTCTQHAARKTTPCGAAPAPPWARRRQAAGGRLRQPHAAAVPVAAARRAPTHAALPAPAQRPRLAPSIPPTPLALTRLHTPRPTPAHPTPARARCSVCAPSRAAPPACPATARRCSASTSAPTASGSRAAAATRRCGCGTSTRSCRSASARWAQGGGHWVYGGVWLAARGCTRAPQCLNQTPLLHAHLLHAPAPASREPLQLGAAGPAVRQHTDARHAALNASNPPNPPPPRATAAGCWWWPGPPTPSASPAATWTAPSCCGTLLMGSCSAAAAGIRSGSPPW